MDMALAQLDRLKAVLAGLVGLAVNLLPSLLILPTLGRTTFSATQTMTAIGVQVMLIPLLVESALRIYHGLSDGKAIIINGGYLKDNILLKEVQIARVESVEPGKRSWILIRLTTGGKRYFSASCCTEPKWVIAKRIDELVRAERSVEAASHSIQ